MILFCLFSSFSCYKNDICPEADSLILEEAMVRGGGMVGRDIVRRANVGWTMEGGMVEVMGGPW